MRFLSFLNPLTPARRLASMVFRQDAMRFWRSARSVFNYRKEVGDGTGSSTVMAPVLWVCRTFPEAPPALWDRLPDGSEEPIHDHPMLRLLTKPNDYYSGVHLWMATCLDYMVDGNAYWFKLRSEAGLPSRLWWVPSWMIEPRGTDDVFITFYEYDTGVGTPQALDPRDVVHFRFGLDPQDQRKGFSQLKSVLREVFTDDEAATFTASLLRNMGVPGLIVSPKDSGKASIDDALVTKRELMERFTGDRRGEPLVLPLPTDVEQFGFSPEQLLMKEIRRLPEERVTAVTGVPAIVAGLGAGLDRSTFTNFAEAREAAYESGIVPMMRIMAEVVRWQLLADFESDPFLMRFGFDLSKVRVLQEDLYRQAQRHDLCIRGGWEEVGEGRAAMGLETRDSDNVFLRPLNVQAVPAGESQPPTAAPANGNGAVHAEEIADAVSRRMERDKLTSDASR